MEKSRSSILKHRGQTYLLEELPRENEKLLNEVEKKIIKSRLDGFSFSQLVDLDAKVAMDRILLSGAAITGCKLPATDFLADGISSEITLFINEFGYGELTLAEILLAMRLNAKGGLKFPSGIEVERVQFSGNCMNVDYLSRVLNNYKTLRDFLNRKLENFIDGYA